MQQVENNNIKLKANVKKLEEEAKAANENIKQLQEEKIVAMKKRNIKKNTPEKNKEETLKENTQIKKELAKCNKSKLE